MCNKRRVVRTISFAVATKTQSFGNRFHARKANSEVKLEYWNVSQTRTMHNPTGGAARRKSCAAVHTSFSG